MRYKDGFFRRQRAEWPPFGTFWSRFGPVILPHIHFDSIIPILDKFRQQGLNGLRVRLLVEEKQSQGQPGDPIPFFPHL